MFLVKKRKKGDRGSGIRLPAGDLSHGQRLWVRLGSSRTILNSRLRTYNYFPVAVLKSSSNGSSTLDGPVLLRESFTTAGAVPNQPPVEMIADLAGFWYPINVTYDF